MEKNFLKLIGQGKFLPHSNFPHCFLKKFFALKLFLFCLPPAKFCVFVVFAKLVGDIVFTHTCFDAPAWNILHHEALVSCISRPRRLDDVSWIVRQDAQPARRSVFDAVRSTARTPFFRGTDCSHFRFSRDCGCYSCVFHVVHISPLRNSSLLSVSFLSNIAHSFP